MYNLTLYFLTVLLSSCGNAYCRSAFLSAINEDNDDLSQTFSASPETHLFDDSEVAVPENPYELLNWCYVNALILTCMLCNMR